VLLEIVFTCTKKFTFRNFAKVPFVPNTMTSFNVFDEICPQPEAFDAGNTLVTLVRFYVRLTMLTMYDLVVAIALVAVSHLYFPRVGKALGQRLQAKSSDEVDILSS
jgi:hypothetical protein